MVQCQIDQSLRYKMPDAILCSLLHLTVCFKHYLLTDTFENMMTVPNDLESMCNNENDSI